MYKNNN